MRPTRPIGGGADPNAAAAAFNSIALLSFPRTAAGPGSVEAVPERPLFRLLRRRGCAGSRERRRSDDRPGCWELGGGRI